VGCGVWGQASAPRRFTCRIIALGGFDSPGFKLSAGHALGVDVDDRSALAKSPGGLRNDDGIVDRCGVDAHLFRARLDQRGDILNRANASAYRERHEALLGHSANHVVRNIAIFVTGGDVEKDQLISAFLVILPGDFDWIAGIAKAHEIDTLDHPAGFDIKTRNDSVRQQSASIIGKRKLRRAGDA